MKDALDVLRTLIVEAHAGKAWGEFGLTIVVEHGHPKSIRTTNNEILRYRVVDNEPVLMDRLAKRHSQSAKP